MNDQRKAFQPLADEFRRAWSSWKSFLSAGAVVGLVGVLLRDVWFGFAWFGFVLMLGSFAVLFYFLVSRCGGGKPLCPSCKKQVLWAGTYCPVCAASIDHSKGFFGPTCSQCGHKIHIQRYDRRPYR